MKKIILFLLLAVMVFTFSACDDKDGNSPSSEQTTGQITELTVWGMTCNRCVTKINNALSDMDGVINVSVDLKAEKVTIEHEPDLNIDTVKSAITAQGFNIP